MAGPSGPRRSRRFVSAAQHGSEIDGAFAKWSGTLRAAEVERLLLEIGVPASVVRDPVAAVDDEQLAYRGLLELLHHPSASEPSGFLGPRLPIDFLGRAADLPPVERSAPAPTRRSRSGSVSTTRCSPACTTPASSPVSSPANSAPR